MSVKLKYGDEWLDPDEAIERRRQDAAKAPPPAPPVDVAALPKGMGLDAMGTHCPAVRHYISANGRIRGGLTPDQQETAKQILEQCR